MKMVPSHETEEEEFRLKFITTGMLSTAELSILQARKELHFFGKHSKKMFGFVRKLMAEPKDKKFNKIYTRIEKYEDICDNVEVEIANYLTQVNQGKLSDLGRKRSRAMLELVDDLESIGDSNFNLARTINRMRTGKIQFSEEILKKLELMFDLVDESLMVMTENLDDNGDTVNISKAKEMEMEINNYRNQLKSEHLDNIKNGKYSYEAGIIFNDLFSECEKLADYAINVSEALNNVKPQ